MNKYILSNTSFHFPIVLSSIGIAFSWIVTTLLYIFGIISLGQDKLDAPFLENAGIVFPLGFFQAITLAAGNTAYFYVSLSILQICKAMGPILLFFLLRIFGLGNFNARVFLSILVMLTGTSMAVWGDVSITAVGLFCIFTAEVSEAARLMLMQILLANKSFSVWEGMYFVSPGILFWLFVASVVLELQNMIDANAWEMVKVKPHLLMATAVLGFFAQYYSMEVVKSAGSLTVKVLSITRTVLLIFYGVVVYHEVVTVIEVIGYAIVLVGFFWYNLATAQQNEEEKRKQITYNPGGSWYSFSIGHLGLCLDEHRGKNHFKTKFRES